MKPVCRAAGVISTVLGGGSTAGIHRKGFLGEGRARPVLVAFPGASAHGGARPSVWGLELGSGVGCTTNAS